MTLSSPPNPFVGSRQDSFTWNLVQLFGELGQEMEVRRNDAISPSEIRALRPRGIVLSPGLCTPNEAGITLDVIRHFGATTPILGVCLGHQAIGQAYGGRVVRTEKPMHGKTCPSCTGERISSRASPLLSRWRAITPWSLSPKACRKSWK